MARKYHNLAGLVRDLEHAIEAGGTQEWDLLSRLDNALLAIEEDDGATVGDSTDMVDDDGDTDSPDDDGDGPHQGSDELLQPFVPRMGTQGGAPGGTQAVPPGTAPVPVVGAIMNRHPTFTARGVRRRGT